jgi:hypothetical protein
MLLVAAPVLTLATMLPLMRRLTSPVMGLQAPWSRLQKLTAATRFKSLPLNLRSAKAEENL